jgi:hypothetical protein
MLDNGQDGQEQNWENESADLIVSRKSAQMRGRMVGFGGDFTGRLDG